MPSPAMRRTSSSALSQGSGRGPVPGERLAEATHLHDRYPVCLGDSARSFLCHPDALGAWVAELDNTVIGHVALHPATSKAVMTLACDRLKVTADRIGVIARLLVSPRHRGQGACRRLLTTAVTEAQARRLWPVLDVDMNLTAAIALYERAGWQRIGVADVASAAPCGTSAPDRAERQDAGLRSGGRACGVRDRGRRARPQPDRRIRSPGMAEVGQLRRTTGDVADQRVQRAG